MINPIEMCHDLSYNKISLRFTEDEIEKKYQQKLKKESVRSQKVAFAISIVTFIMSSTLLFILNSQSKYEDFVTLMIAFCLLTYSVGLCIIFLLTSNTRQLKLFKRIKILVFFYLQFLIS